MVTSAHEGMPRIFQERPEILSPVFGVLGIAFPEKAAVYAIGTDVTEARPLARHVDTVLRIGPSDGQDFLLAVEAQERRDTKKESSWPYYIAYLQAKYGLQVLLLVVCRDRATRPLRSPYVLVLHVLAVKLRRGAYDSSVAAAGGKVAAVAENFPG